MKQQINLFRVEEKKKGFTFSYEEMVRMLSFFAVLLALITAYDVFNHFYIQKELKKAEKKQSDINAKLQATEKKIPTQQTREQIIAEIKRLEEDLLYKKEMNRTLSEAKIQKLQGFSEYFESLSRQSIAGVWLTQMVFKKNKEYFSIQGKTLKPEFIPKLIAALSQEHTFAGKTFQFFKLETDKETKEIKFSLETEPPKKL